MVEIRWQLLEALAGHDVVVVSGETGSGKTTQVPQFILEDAEERGQGGACSVVCTQPRRIAAISVAERVAAERGEPAPGEAGARVGYHVRLDAARTADTHLLFCTTGACVLNPLCLQSTPQCLRQETRLSTVVIAVATPTRCAPPFRRHPAAPPGWRPLPALGLPRGGG